MRSCVVAVKARDVRCLLTNLWKCCWTTVMHLLTECQIKMMQFVAMHVFDSASFFSALVLNGFWTPTGWPKNGNSYLNALTSSNINRFSKWFHCQNQEKICNNTITKDPITPQVCRYTTLWNVKCLKTNNWKQDHFCITYAFLKKLTTGNNVFIVSVIV